MNGHSLRCVILRRSVANEKCPIARLREQELARELTQDAVIISPWLPATRFCQRGHAAVRRQKMRINPATHQENLDHPSWRSPAPSPAGSDFVREIRSAWSAAIYFPPPPESGAQEKLVLQTTNVRRVRHRKALS